MTQSFRRIKLDANDILYSKIIRYGVNRCFRCHLWRDVQCAHIMSRRYYSTRFTLTPKPNAIPLCASCHDWFDSHKDNTPIFNEEARRYFMPAQNSYAFLVKRAVESGGYTWEDLQILYVKSQGVFTGYVCKKKQINLELKAALAMKMAGEAA